MATCDLSRIPTQVENSPRRHRRRDFLTIGAAAAAGVAGITVSPAMADPFAFARIADGGDDPDAAILDLFRQWRSAFAAANAVTGRDCDPEVEVVTGLAEQIFGAPVNGTAGLAVKTFMLAYEIRT